MSFFFFFSVARGVSELSIVDLTRMFNVLMDLFILNPWRRPHHISEVPKET